MLDLSSHNKTVKDRENIRSVVWANNERGRDVGMKSQENNEMSE